MSFKDDISFFESQIRSLENELRQSRQTMRDEYARAALQGLIAYGYSPREAVVDEAFKIADIAMKARTQ